MRSEKHGNATSMRYEHKRDIDWHRRMHTYMGVYEDMVKERSEQDVAES